MNRYSSWQLEDTNHLQKETFEEYDLYHKAKKSHCFTKAKGRWKYSVLTTSFVINASWKCQRENEHTLKNQGNILCEEKLSVLMEARWIFIFNSTDFCSSSQGQCLKKIYLRHPWQALLVNSFSIAFVLFPFADISDFFCTMEC